MNDLGHSSWQRQTVSQVEKAERNLTVDELISLAAAVETSLAFLLSPASPIDPRPGLGIPVDAGGPKALDHGEIGALYGFNVSLAYPFALGSYAWPETTFHLASNWDESLERSFERRVEGEKQ